MSKKSVFIYKTLPLPPSSSHVLKYRNMVIPPLKTSLNFSFLLFSLLFSSSSSSSVSRYIKLFFVFVLYNYLILFFLCCCGCLFINGFVVILIIAVSPTPNLPFLCLHMCLPSVCFGRLFSSSSSPLAPNLTLLLLIFTPSFLPSSSSWFPPSWGTRQHWDEGRGDPEEPERAAAGAGPAPGPQPVVLAAAAGAQPQPAGGVDLPQHGVLLGQTALQLSDSKGFWGLVSETRVCVWSKHVD